MNRSDQEASGRRPLWQTQTRHVGAVIKHELMINVVSFCSFALPPALNPHLLRPDPAHPPPGMASILMSAVGLGVHFTSAPLPQQQQLQQQAAPFSLPPPPPPPLLPPTSRPSDPPSSSSSSVRRAKRQQRRGSYQHHRPPPPTLPPLTLPVCTCPSSFLSGAALACIRPLSLVIM